LPRNSVGTKYKKRVPAAAVETGLRVDPKERMTFPRGQRSGIIRRISWYRSRALCSEVGIRKVTGRCVERREEG
jgi:hypothetical protein